MDPADLTSIVRGTQMASALAWVLVMHHYAGQALRVLSGRNAGWDAAGAWAFALGFVQTGFVIRWLVIDSAVVPLMSQLALSVWAVLYIANGGVALGILHTWRFRATDVPRANRRARAGMAVWVIVLSASIGAMWAVA